MATAKKGTTAKKTTAATKKPTVKKSTVKKTAPVKKNAFSDDDKRTVWLIITVLVSLMAFLAFYYFAKL